MAKRITMGFETIDRYLLGEPVSKPDVVAALLADRSNLPAAQAFYRALETIGPRAADEAFIALRLVLAGKTADDTTVRRLRAISTLARAARTADNQTVAATLAERRSDLPADLPAATDLQALQAAATAAYHAELW